MSPRLNRSLQIAIDVAIMSFAYWLAFLFRFEFRIPAEWSPTLLVTWPYIVILQYACLAVFGVPRMSWRYFSIGDAARVWFAASVAAAAFAAVRLGGREISEQLQVVVIPLGVLAMNFALVFLGLTGVRALRRLQGEAYERHQKMTGIERHRVLLVGAGQAGVIVAREIANRPDLNLKTVGFVDDDPAKIGTRIGGIPVLGATRDVAEIAARKHVERVLITISNAGGHEIRRIAELCRDAELDTKIIPGIYEIVGDKVNLSRIREVAIEDLLGRDPVKLDEDVVSAAIRSRVVLVTGAGGSIGSELCRQVCRFGPERLVLVERFENALFEIHRELAASFPQLLIEPRIADVCDASRMDHVFEIAKPEIVFHAAAHKHVPMMEWNPGEAVKNNVGGTRTVADLAHRHGVQRFVLISTDKAVNPTSVLGATKRVAEIYLQTLSERSSTRFVTVRFGNVLGSNGSVIPTFRKQIAKGGPVTVTHPEMKRFFMTIPEASQLVLQAGAMGQGGEIFILDMGTPMKIVDLARDLITLSGLRPDEDIKIEFSGVRPGEKLFEELSSDAEQADKTRHPKILIGRAQAPALPVRAAPPKGGAEVDAQAPALPVRERVFDAVGTLIDRAHEADLDRVRSALGDLVPEYRAHRPSRPTMPGSSLGRDTGSHTEPN
jgi:FlaA1/EpsC-like NDP-sugar epimerase